MTPERPQLTSLLPNEVLSRLERLRIQPLRKLTNRARGEHYAGKGGTSAEFCDYKDYAPGDDTRFVDWNIFSRLHRPYLKVYHREEVRHVVLLVDASTSMVFEKKLERAKQLAAAFGVMGLLNNERVSVYVSQQVDDGAPTRLPPMGGRLNMRSVFSFIENIEGGGGAPLERGIEQLLKYHHGRGVCVVLSDFLTFGDMVRGMNLLFSSGLEIFGVQVLGPSEIDPDVSGDLRFIDSETAQTLDVSSAADLVSLYQEYRAAYENELATMCRRRSGRFVSVSSEFPLHWVLFDLLRRKGWIA